MHLTVAIECVGEPDRELRSLRDWLRADDEFSGRAEIPISASAAGEMGAMSDTLSVLSRPGEAVALASAVCVWLRTRKSDVKVRFRRDATACPHCRLVSQYRTLAAQRSAPSG